ncbi:MAG TPA: response regulator, partial [Patescibacteria group bacterium]|nr:response regulator [Patescibacteria group bacterium]
FMGMIMYTVRDDVGLQHSLNAMGIAYLSKPASRRGLGEAVKDAARKTVKSATSGPIRLLIAEDTASVRDILQRQLQKLGVEADFVEDGAKALEALDTGKYGILFTDLHMPEIDGYELVELIRQKEAEAQAMRKKGDVQTHFPVIVLTADVQMGQRQVYMSHGFDECLLKPVSIGHLQRLLMRWGLLDEGKIQVVDDEVAAERQITKPAQPPALDIEKVKEQMGGLDEGTVEMLQMFVGMTEPLISRLRATLDNGDFNGLKETAHSLKGAARSACCNVLGDVAAALQEDAAAKKPTCARLVATAEREFERATREIHALKRA